VDYWRISGNVLKQSECLSRRGQLRRQPAINQDRRVKPSVSGSQLKLGSGK